MLLQKEAALNGYTCVVGVDWGSEEHEVTSMTVPHGESLKRRVKHQPGALKEMCDWLLARFGGDASKIAIAIEVPRGPLVETFMERGFHVYWLNPKQLDRFRDRHSVPGAKDDSLDSLVLADSLRTDMHLFQQARMDDAAIVQLRELNRMFVELGGELQRALNRLDAQLGRYYPQISALSPKPDDRWIWELVETAPTPERARRLSLSKIEALLRKYRIRRFTAEEVQSKLREPAFHVAPGTVEAASRHALALVEQAKLLMGQRRDVEKDTDTILKDLVAGGPDEGNGREHHDAEIILSVPGCGNHFTATMLAEASQALAERNYSRLRASAGVAPVTKRSGKSIAVTKRYACSRRFERAVHHATASYVSLDPKGRALYAALRARGHNHNRALRAVGDSLLRLIIALLKADTLYDPLRRQTVPAQPTIAHAA